MTADSNHPELKSFCERISNVMDEKAQLTKDINTIIAEAKGEGYNPKTLRRTVKEMRRDPSKRKEEDDELDVYLLALGLL